MGWIVAQWQDCMYPGTSRGQSNKRQLTAQCMGSFAHAHHAEMPRVFPIGAGSVAVVLDVETQVVILPLNRHVNLTGLGMTKRIG